MATNDGWHQSPKVENMIRKGDYLIFAHPDGVTWNAYHRLEYLGWSESLDSAKRLVEKTRLEKDKLAP